MREELVGNPRERGLERTQIGLKNSLISRMTRLENQQVVLDMLASQYCGYHKFTGDHIANVDLDAAEKSERDLVDVWATITVRRGDLELATFVKEHTGEIRICRTNEGLLIQCLNHQDAQLVLDEDSLVGWGDVQNLHDSEADNA